MDAHANMDGLPVSEPAGGLPPHDVVVHEVHDQQRHPIHHRTVPLPMRVKSGSVTEQGLQVETAHDRVDIPWDTVELVALAMLEEQAAQVEGPKSGLRQMLGKMTGKATENEERKMRQVRELYLLDLYVRDQDQPYRIDSATVNYRALLDRVSYMSFQNFFRLVIRICRHCVNARFDSSLTAFLNRRKDQVKRYGAIYDYELEMQQVRARLEDLPGREDLNLERETWADEWDDYA